MFGNKQLEINDLPKVEHVHFKKLDAKYTKVVRIRVALSAILILLISFFPYGLQFFTSVMLLDNALLLSIGGAGVVLVLMISIALMIGIRMKGYALREHDIIYKTGWINRSQTVVPFNRVQHVGVYESALLRIYDLCTIEFFTAGGTLGDLKISGISKEEGERLKAYVVQKITRPKEIVHEDNAEDLKGILNSNCDE